MLSKGCIDFQRDRKTEKNACPETYRPASEMSPGERKPDMKKVTYLLT